MTLYNELKEIMEKDGENFEKRICTLSEDELKKCDRNRNPSIPSLTNNIIPPFTAWGEKWVYFPILYDCWDWISHVPRNPCDIATDPDDQY